MTPDMKELPAELGALAGKLTKAQRNYLAAVHASEAAYLPRHGATASWALRHKLTYTILRLNDGRIGSWDSFQNIDFHDKSMGIAEVLGERLTETGEALAAYLQANPIPDLDSKEVGR